MGQCEEDFVDEEGTPRRAAESAGCALSADGKQSIVGLEGGEQKQDWACCDFETAVSATGYGKYNLLMMVASFFGIVCSFFATGTMSFILPAATCDLGLDNFDKGLLNAVAYFGMICSSFPWGFLSDTLGRKRLLVISFCVQAVCAIFVGLAQDFITLVIVQFIAGINTCGPYPILMSYLAENHATQYRPSIILWSGVFGSSASIFMPALAWAIIPQGLQWDPLPGISLPSWRLFLLVTAAPGFISSFLFTFFFESPKFLMSRGLNEEALTIFRKIYAINTGRPEERFPVTGLVDDKRPSGGGDCSAGCGAGHNSRSKALQFVAQGWRQMQPLFQRPHLPNAMLLFLIQFGALFGLNTIRLWTPQLFSSIINNEKSADGNMTASSICQLLDMDRGANSSDAEDAAECSSLVEDRVYTNSMLIGLVTGLAFLTSGYIIKVLGSKCLMVSGYIAGGATCIAMYWATSSDTLLVLACIHNAVLSVASTSIVTVVVDLFPTAHRAMAVTLTMMFGLVGAMSGNLIFPIVLDWNCSVPFFLLAADVFVTAAVTLLLPKTKGKALE